MVGSNRGILGLTLVQKHWARGHCHSRWVDTVDERVFRLGLPGSATLIRSKVLRIPVSISPASTHQIQLTTQHLPPIVVIFKHDGELRKNPRAFAGPSSLKSLSRISIYLNASKILVAIGPQTLTIRVIVPFNFVRKICY